MACLLRFQDFVVRSRDGVFSNVVSTYWFCFGQWVHAFLHLCCLCYVVVTQTCFRSSMFVNSVILCLEQGVSKVSPLHDSSAIDR